MAIVNVISSFSQFMDCVPKSRVDQFSYYGWECIFDYIESVSDDTGENIELDIVSICCEYCEYTNVDDFVKDYGFEFSDDGLDDDEKLEEIRDYLNDNTTLFNCEDDCILFVNF